MIVHFGFEFLACLNGIFEPRAFLHFNLRCLRIVPQCRVFGELIQRVEPSQSVIPVKDASEATPMIVLYHL
jgi:hypothetical protein